MNNGRSLVALEYIWRGFRGVGGGMRAAVAVLRPSPGFCFVAPYVAVYCSVTV